MDFSGYWGWLTAGMILMVLEVITPGIFFMWIGIGAFITGFIAFLAPNLSPEVLGAIFAVLSVIAVIVGKKIVAKKEPPETTLNNRMNSYIGQTFQAYEAFKDGRGKVSVGDSLWLALAKTDIPTDTAVKVIGVKGTYLEVEPVNDE